MAPRRGDDESAEEDSLARSIDLAERLRSAIGSERTLDAIASVPREWFVPGRERVRAYDNVAPPISCGQTISQPLVVARTPID